jgi:hypothetical protein
MKICFLVVLDHFFQKNGLNDLVRSFFISLDIRPYIPHTCGPSGTFLGQFGGAQMAPKKKQHKETVFWLIRTISPKGMHQMLWLGAYFKLIYWAIHPPTCKPLGTFLGWFGGAQMAPKKSKVA